MICIFWRTYLSFHCNKCVNLLCHNQNVKASQCITKQKLQVLKWTSLTAKFKNYVVNTKVKCTYGKTNNALITVKSFIQRRVFQLWLWNMLEGASPLSNTTLEMTAYKKHCTCLDAFHRSNPPSSQASFSPSTHLSGFSLSLITNTDAQTDTNTVSGAVKDHLTYHVHASFSQRHERCC